MSDLICTHRELINWYEEQEQLPLKENDSTRDVNGSEYAHGYKITHVCLPYSVYLSNVSYWIYTTVKLVQSTFTF